MMLLSCVFAIKCIFPFYNEKNSVMRTTVNVAVLCSHGDQSFGVGQNFNGSFPDIKTSTKFCPKGAHQLV